MIEYYRRKINKKVRKTAQKLFLSIGVGIEPEIWVKWNVRILSVFGPILGRKFKYFKIVSLNSLDNVSFFGELKYEYSASAPQYFYDNKPLVKISSKIANVTLLQHVEVIGGSNVVSFDDKTLYEISFCTFRNNMQIVDPAVVLDAGEWLIVRTAGTGTTIDSGILISGNGSNNFYHLFYDCFSKLIALENSSIPFDVPIIVDECVRKVPQFSDVLQKLNRSSRPILYLEKEKSYKIKNCYYIPIVNIIPLQYKDLSQVTFSDCCFNLRCIDFFRENLLSVMNSECSPKKIFIARKKNLKARRYNQEEILAMFESNGFEVVYPESLPILQQIKLFNNADFIAGASGAAFTNLAFCSAHCKVLMIMGYHIDLSIFSTIAKYVGADLQYYSAKPEGYVPGNIHEDFCVDVDDLEKVLLSFVESTNRLH